MYAGRFDPLAQLGDVEEFDAPPFTVVRYRGSFVWTQLGWVQDAEARGGVGPVPVPNGAFSDLESMRFGAEAPYVFELPPLWWLVEDGVDVYASKFLSLFGVPDISAVGAEQWLEEKGQSVQQTVADFIAKPLNIAVAAAGVAAIVWLAHRRQ
jgi:hypothetical protein